ncbi:MAG: arylamine N-acetyltransferase, partial [Actinobacteria bacterium]|nr:arylamine N-acetyltransferase [Actinomycetota bacterium]
MITDDDISAYLQRLGIEAEPPSVDALFRLHRAHLEHVPYETTWIHMDERWGVDRAESLRRIAHQRTGGYCFHLNGAMSLLLEHLGYDVTLHIGGVHGPDGPNEEAMHNHLVLQVHGLPGEGNEAGDWYLDAGLGDALHEPLPLVPGSYWQGPFEFDLAAGDSPVGDWRFVHHPRGSFSGMVFRAGRASIDDFAERNVHLSTSPESGFVRLLTVQR